MAEFSQRVQVSTQGIAFFNDERIMMKIVYLQDAITININFPQISAENKVSYPQELRHSVLLNQNNVCALQELIANEIMPAYAEGNNKDVGVFTNRAKTQMFEVMIKGGTFFAVIHDEIENRVPKNSYFFKFDKTQIIKDYNIEAVSFNTEELEAQFLIFCKMLTSFSYLSGGITAHEYQYRQSYFVDQIRQIINALNTKFNLGIGYQRQNSGNSGFGGGFDSSSTPNPVQVQETNMHDLMNGVLNGPEEVPFN